MKRVLHITSSLSRNGTEAFIMNVFRNIDRSSIMFDFLVFTESTDGYYDEVKSLGAKIYRLPERRKGFIRYYSSLKHFFKQYASEYNAIHFSGCSLTSILPIYFAFKYKIPIRIVHAHNSSWRGLHNLILHKINRLIIPLIATDYLACSKCASDWFYITPIRGKCIILNNGIKTELFEYDLLLRNKYRKLLGWEDKFVIGHVGRFVKEKNHVFLINLFSEIIKYVPNAKLVLVGVGELKDCIQAMAIDMKIYDRIEFLGNRTDVNCLLQAFDCFVLPSLFEGLPFVLVEAQCSGLKVLTSTNVSEESKITDNISFLPLHDMNIWIKEILECKKFKRVNTTEDIISHGYSITDTVKILTKIYQQ